MALGALWYLFIYPYDYMVRMKVNTFPGTIKQTLKLWDSNLTNAQILEQEGLHSVLQEITFGDSTHLYKWEVIPENDSLSSIKVFVKDRENSLSNKIKVPFADTDFEKRTRKTLKDFLDQLTEHIESFRVTLKEPEEFQGKFCACTSLSTSQFKKADGMMKDYPLLNNILVKSGLQLDGPPLVEVTAWDREEDWLKYNFCYPIKRTDSLPEHPDLVYKEIQSRKALKAEYNGNYVTSDRAWYFLLDHASKKEIEVTGLPIEVFFNNPTLGGDALRWKAEVYMPIVENDQ